MTGPGGTYQSESVWNNSASSAGGGGLSAHFDRPSYQVGPGVINSFSNGKREVPDVSADGDPTTGYSVYCTVVEAGCNPSVPWTSAGGTSVSTPLWAAMTANINQYLNSQGKPAIGNAHDLLYQLFNTPQTFAAYHDITAGDNRFYPATAGYDMASGVGTPDAFNIARDLAAMVTTAPVTSLSVPARLVDTRTAGGPIASGASRCFGVAGLAGIPANAAAVVLNMTAVGQTTNGWLTVYPNGQAVPSTSTLNFGTSEFAIANGTIMRLGTGGQVCVNVGTVNSVPGSARAILDATGFLPSGAPSQVAMLPSPVRLADTRTSGGPIATGASRCFQISGLASIPRDAAAVVLNVTAVGYSTNGWLTVYPNRQALPGTSSVNFDRSEYAIANNTSVRIGAAGQVCVNVGTVNSAPGSSDVVLDATGYLTSSALVHMPMLSSPQRLYDTRRFGGPISSGQTRCFIIGGLIGIPTNATGVVLNVTAVGYAQRDG